MTPLIVGLPNQLAHDGFGRVGKFVCNTLALHGIPHVVQPYCQDSVYDISVGGITTHAQSKVHFTMWETTKAPDERRDMLRKTCKHLIVPTVDSAKALGHPKTEIVPLGANVMPLPLPAWKPFTFLFIGNNQHQFNRKKPDVIAEAFKLAFPHESDVKLIIKQSPDCPPVFNYDSRIDVIRAVLSHEQMEALFAKSHCVVNISGLEGWSYPLHDAIAHGRPVITPLFGAIQAFCTIHNTWHVPFKEVRAPAAIYHNSGSYASVSAQDLARVMRKAYEDRYLMLCKATAALQMATFFNIETTQAHLFKTLCHFGICSSIHGPLKVPLSISAVK